ncbi:MAG TPA: hypothetical protein VGX26_10145 [Solirubrobacteraceae bacterium]|jgi:hypothetical protein|nr:hypothetical protein [Solirubrobacteraceae bacterium]
MTSTVLIPAEIVDLLRDGLRSQIALGAHDLKSAEEQLDAREHPERYQDPLRCMDALRALLDEIGWSTPASDRQVDLTIHGAALIDALQDQLSVHANMARDITQDDERREAIARDVNELTVLSLTVLLRTQARMLRAVEVQAGCAAH